MDDRLEEPMEFTSAYREVQVTVDGDRYSLREASGDTATAFINAKAKAIGGIATGGSMGDVGSLAPLLVGRCLCNAAGKTVGPQKVASWPSPIQDKLYQRALDLSNLRDRDETVAGQLAKALADPASPVSLEDLRAYVLQLDTDEFKNLRNLFTPTQQEAGKN